MAKGKPREGGACGLVVLRFGMDRETPSGSCGKDVQKGSDPWIHFDMWHAQRRGRQRRQRHVRATTLAGLRKATVGTGEGCDQFDRPWAP